MSKSKGETKKLTDTVTDMQAKIDALTSENGNLKKANTELEKKVRTAN